MSSNAKPSKGSPVKSVNLHVGEIEPGVAKVDPIIVIDGVTRVFGGLTAVDVDHLEIPRNAITALIGTMADRGRKFTDGRNALIAHALFTGVKPSVIVEESKVDKGDVSRIAKRLSELKACKPTTREG